MVGRREGKRGSVYECERLLQENLYGRTYDLGVASENMEIMRVHPRSLHENELLGKVRASNLLSFSFDNSIQT